jgi:hypothetical protein
MDYDEYKNLIKQIKRDFGESLGIDWRVPSLKPVPDLYSPELLGWKLSWAGPFTADKHFVCVREHWSRSKGKPYLRKFFSYHYGPFVQLNNLENAKPKAVVARIDAISYDGRGFHIHDGSKDRRIYQDELANPQLSEFSITDFIACVTTVRKGRSVTEAFDLRFKE